MLVILGHRPGHGRVGDLVVVAAGRPRRRRPVRAGRMSVHRPEGLSDVFMEPTEAPPRRRPTLPTLGLVGWLRWAWRQLTSMRVALLLLMLLAVAAVPGTVWPQRAQDTAKVAHVPHRPPDSTGPWLDRLGFFNVYSSVWFSAIYLLLFVSLVGCILPRTKVHLAGVRGRPPRAPRRFARFPAQGSGVARRDAGAGRRRRRGRAARRLALAPVRPDVPRRHPRRGRRHRLGVRGARLPARDRQPRLPPRARRAADLRGHRPGAALPRAGDRRAGPRVRERAGRLRHVRAGHRVHAVEPRAVHAAARRVRVPLRPGHAAVPRLHRARHADQPRRGRRSRRPSRSTTRSTPAAPRSTCRATATRPTSPCATPPGRSPSPVPTPFLPQDEVYTSRGVVKVPDVSGDQEQIGLVGYLLPTVDVQRDRLRACLPLRRTRSPTTPRSSWRSGRATSGLDTGVPQNVYQLDEARMTQLVDADGKPVTLVVQPGETVDLPDGMGTLTFNDLPRYVALDLRHDPALPFVLVFALLAFAGLATSLFAPRRRLWLRLAPGAGDGRRSYSGHRGRAGTRRRRRPPARARPGARGDARPHRRQTPGRSRAAPPQERPRHDHR